MGLEEDHENLKPNQVMKVIRKHLNQTRKLTNHVTIKQNHQVVVEEEVIAVAVVVAVVDHVVVADQVVVAVTVEVATVDAVDIEAVVVAAVVVKEVIVPLANKKSKTVKTLPFNFHLISELFLPPRTENAESSLFKFKNRTRPSKKINHMTRLRISRQ